MTLAHVEHACGVCRKLYEERDDPHSLWSERGAVLDIAGTYRYRLWRRVGSTLFRVCWILLNPSTADASLDDPTIRRCTGFVKQWGQQADGPEYGWFDVVNLFAFRSTIPEALKTAADPIGPENDAHILDAARGAHLVVCAWGTHGGLRGRSKAVIELLRTNGIEPRCLKLSKGGEPVHPLYQPGSLVPVQFAI